ncbi:MAG TPA: hypothetical protein DDW27_20930 [Bacteroidales bacterium]|nr:hypothetical protein [Bacteroidales bacterium]
MKKLLTLIAAILIAGSIYAGGLVTNNNHSALFTRMQNRNSSTLIDATYFNPAGLTRLGNGLYVSLNNQTIGQTRTITNDYMFLNGVSASSPREYEGKVSAPVYPAAYIAFKAGKLAISAGFNPIGGGGGATYDAGLPSIEMPISELKPLLTGMGLTTTQYAADIAFEGRSIYFGYQANISYAINDMISAAIGARLVTAKNTYNGHVSDIKINPLHPQINPTAALISAPQFFTTINQPLYAAMTSDREVDVQETGKGITPILSLHVSPFENLNIAVRYEFKTKLELTTEVFNGKDGGLFDDGEKVIADMPAMLATGVDYKLMDRLMVAFTVNMYSDKKVDYDGSETVNVDMIDKNFLEYGAGAEFGITDNIRVSAGWLATATGVNEKYLSDIRYSTNTNTFGGGFGFRIAQLVDLNIGAQYTLYDEGSKSFTRTLGINNITVNETYKKSTWAVGVGLDFYFGKK